MDLFSRLVVHYWEILAPVIAIMRRKRGDVQYANFEYVAILARAWLEEHPSGRFPKKVPRMTLKDPWLEADRART